MKNFLISGDSFAANWPDKKGWPDLLSSKCNVTNVAQAGCSEYKIYKQLLSVNLDDFDYIIVSHTSPYRLYVEQHPVHVTGFHKDADFLYGDILNASKGNPELEPIVKYFENFMSTEYQDFMYKLICKEIRNIIGNRPCTHMIHLDVEMNEFPVLDFHAMWKKHRGDINHYDELGNSIIYDRIRKTLPFDL